MLEDQNNSPPPSMQSASPNSKISDEELALFLEEISLFGEEQEDDEKERISFPPTSRSDPIPDSLSKKSFSFPWVWGAFLLAVCAGFVTGWLLKPQEPQPRPITVVGEEILQLLRELKLSLPSQDPLPGYEIIEPIEIEGPDDFSVA